MANVGSLIPLDRMARGHWPTRWLVAAAFTVPLLVIAATIAQPFADPKWLYLDPLAAAERAPECCRVYFGAMSMLGVMMWVVAAGVCLFTALLFLPHRPVRAAATVCPGGRPVHRVAGPR